ncbi:MAG: quinone-dependent dihydroorotate dehydrogenase [Puniceicoccales bacterium]|jgi:dihydroorotate dehydrogenase|nr:quinone-dependent dihydroorotate dehydrogenase [Puniceicoccales bacterium]
MDIFYEKIIRPLCFIQDPEAIHERTINALRLLDALPFAVRLLEHFNLRPRHGKPVSLFGLDFPNRVGLAAGYDKHALAWTAMGALGFGHVEIGTVTLHAQPGNPRPRLFRYPAHEAVVNRYGFPNPGAEAVALRLANATGKGRRSFPLGINIGKSKITSLEDAHKDYIGSFRLLADYADFMVVNISSPNTPGLRELQGREHLVKLLNALQAENRARAARLKTAPVPILLKIAPDLTFPQLDDILGIVTDAAFSGIVATNTTIARPEELGPLETTGGLSGHPLLEKSLGIVRYLARASGGKIPIVGSGGICCVEDAGRFMDEGASLVQLYTGMVYRGPWFPAAVAKALAWRDRDWVGKTNASA